MTKTILPAILIAPLIFAQQPTFEVVSVMPADPNLRQGINAKVLPGGRFVATMCTLGQLIEIAYGIEHYQRKGGPAWIDESRFDVVAISSPGDENGDHLMISGRSWPRRLTVMLQAMLADRFNLKTHLETVQENGFMMSLAKGGPKFVEAPPDDDRQLVTLDRPGPRELPATTYIIKGHRASMYLLAVELAQHFGTPVIDNTGLTGDYNFQFEYGADDTRPENGPSIFTAIQEQIGIKLSPGKGPVNMLLVDSAQKPSAN